MRAALASVARRHGSLPMSASAKMLVTLEGERTGTVGGGCLEAEIIERAMAVAASGVPELSKHTLNHDLAGDYGLTCGGTVELLIEPVFADPALAEVWSGAVAALDAEQRAAMVTGLEWSSGPAKRLELAAPDAPISDDERPRFDGEAGELREPLIGSPRLIVCGAGHVGAQIAAAAHAAGWLVTVVDDRAEYADPSRFPFADRVVAISWDQVTEGVRIDQRSWVVLATRGHQHDVLLASLIAPLRPRYLGALGSRRKGVLTAEALKTLGVLDEDAQRIRTPVGLDIGADTPAEIAVSVVAEMISLRRQRIST